MRMEHKKSALELSHCKITGTKPRNFKVPNRRALQSQRKSRSGFVFYGNIDPFDIYRSCRVRRVEFQLAFQFPEANAPRGSSSRKNAVTGTLSPGGICDCSLVAVSLDGSRDAASGAPMPGMR